MTSELDPSSETTDRTKYLWIGIIVLLVIMVLVLVMSERRPPNRSQVLVRHILIQFEQEDPAKRAEALEFIRGLRERVEAGESFADLAKQFSEDPVSASRGGLLGWHAKGEFEDAFEAHVWEAEVGALSQPIATRYGYHLIIVEDRYLTDADRYDLEVEQRLREEGGAAPDVQPPG